MNRFFKPFVGQNYHNGVNGKKILVVGASFYCSCHDCIFFDECTNVLKKDSSPFDAKCPHAPNDNEGYLLSKEPSNAIESEYGVYKTFAEVMGHFIGTQGYEETWSHLAFTNYVQFFLPSNVGRRGNDTKLSDLSERDFEAFNETLLELEPDIVVIWGCTINNRLKQENEFVIDKEALLKSNHYICHLKLPEMDKIVTLINCYHPSSSYWNDNLDEFERYFKQSLTNKTLSCRSLTYKN